MKTLNVTISDNEYKKYGIKKDSLTFDDVVHLINRQQFREHLQTSVELAEKYGLSNITLDEINEEIKAEREDAKNRH